MQVTKTVDETRAIIKAWKKEGLTIGLVPTMGFLHEGHASLIRKAREENDRVVVSDFVNPTQFGPTEDLAAYPRDFERDSQLCESLGADLIFHPEPEDMYDNPCAYVSIEKLSDNLCGLTRPIHFRGVCTDRPGRRRTGQILPEHLPQCRRAESRSVPVPQRGKRKRCDPGRHAGRAAAGRDAGRD